jgi:hypothetical protein
LLKQDPFKKRTTPPTEVRDAVSKRFREAFDDAFPNVAVSD